jgi:tetratricopeptide (TPR) repeat protein
MQKLADQLASISPDSEESLLAQGRMRLVTFDFPSTIELYTRQMKLFPGSAESLRYGATAEMLQGNLEAAIAIYEQAVELDPLSLNVLVNSSMPLFMNGQCDDVREIMKRVLELQPNYGRVRGVLGYCLLMHGGDVQEAKQLLEQEPTGWMHRTGLAIVADRLGDRALSQQHLDSMIAEYGDAAAYQYAQIASHRGDMDEAIKWLNVAFDVADPGFIYVCTDPFTLPVQSDSRFIELFHKTGLDRCPGSLVTAAGS